MRILLISLFLLKLSCLAQDECLTLESKSIGRKAIYYLLSKQNVNGSWGSGEKEAEVTAKVINSLLTQDYKKSSELNLGLNKGLRYLENHLIELELNNTATASVAMLSLMLENFFFVNFKKYRKEISQLRKLLKYRQNTNRDSVLYGAFVDEKMPPLISTSIAIEALYITRPETSIDNEINSLEEKSLWEAAINYIERCQILSDQLGLNHSLDGAFALKANVDRNKSTEVINTNGYLVCLGLKSFLYGEEFTSKERIDKALTWLNYCYTLEENPNAASNDFYSYVLNFTKVLDALGLDKFKDKDGNRHNWREDLLISLINKQELNGSWGSKSDEQNALITNTSDSLLSINIALNHQNKKSIQQ